MYIHTHTHTRINCLGLEQIVNILKYFLTIQENRKKSKHAKVKLTAYILYIQNNDKIERAMWGREQKFRIFLLRYSHNKYKVLCIIKRKCILRGGITTKYTL